LRRVGSASLAGPACAAVLPALAQSEEKGVPVLMAPFHVPAMKNEFGTVLIINIPPGRNSGYHIHSADSLSVNIEAADMTNQNLGSSQVGPPNRAQIGRILYTPYYKEGERTHKATNVGPTHFHNVSFVFSSRTPHGFTPSTRPAGYQQLDDNERYRAWRLTLAARTIRPCVQAGRTGPARCRRRRRAHRIRPRPARSRHEASRRRILLAGSGRHARGEEHGHDAAQPRRN